MPSRQFPSPGSVLVRYGAIWPIPTYTFRDPSVGAYDSLHLHFGCFPLSFAPPYYNKKLYIYLVISTKFSTSRYVQYTHLYCSRYTYLSIEIQL